MRISCLLLYCSIARCVQEVIIGLVAQDPQVAGRLEDLAGCTPAGSSDSRCDVRRACTRKGVLVCQHLRQFDVDWCAFVVKLVHEFLFRLGYLVLGIDDYRGHAELEVKSRQRRALAVPEGSLGAALEDLELGSQNSPGAKDHVVLAGCLRPVSGVREVEDDRICVGAYDLREEADRLRLGDRDDGSIVCIAPIRCFGTFCPLRIVLRLRELAGGPGDFAAAIRDLAFVNRRVRPVRSRRHLQASAAFLQLCHRQRDRRLVGRADTLLLVLRLRLLDLAPLRAPVAIGGVAVITGLTRSVYFAITTPGIERADRRAAVVVLVVAIVTFLEFVLGAVSAVEFAALGGAVADTSRAEFSFRQRVFIIAIGVVGGLQIGAATTGSAGLLGVTRIGRGATDRSVRCVIRITGPVSVA